MITQFSSVSMASSFSSVHCPSVFSLRWASFYMLHWVSIFLDPILVLILLNGVVSILFGICSFFFFTGQHFRILLVGIEDEDFNG